MEVEGRAVFAAHLVDASAGGLETATAGCADFERNYLYPTAPAPAALVDWAKTCLNLTVKTASRSKGSQDFVVATRGASHRR